MRSSRKEDRRRRRRPGYSSEEKDSECGSGSVGFEAGPEVVVEDTLSEFPGVVDDLKQLIQMIDNGQDIKGISERALVSHLRKLFLLLNLKESNGVYLLPADLKPVLAVVGPVIYARVGSGDTIIKPNEPDQSSQVEPISVQAQAELRDTAADDDTELFIGPAPSSMVAEDESANEAKRFEEVTRIMGADADNPYDVLGVNPKMSAKNVK